MLREAINSYIAMRRAVGFQLQVQEGLLYNFARHAEERSQTFVERHTAID